MSLTEVTSHSWLSRIIGALKGLVLGFVLIPAAMVLLYWNESRSVNTYESLKEGAKAVISADAKQINTENEGKLIHITGKARTEEVLQDPEFEVSANALRLKRKAEMYQWRERRETETRKKLGGGSEEVTHYYYEKVWSEERIDSRSFREPTGHENPQMPHQSKEYIANQAKLEAFDLPTTLLRDLNVFIPLPIENKQMVIFHNTIFLGQNSSDPQIGDMKIEFSQVPTEMQVSTYAQQSNGALAPYVTKRGQAIMRIEPGVRTADEMFKAAQAENEMLTWLLRVVGFVVILIGFTLIFHPLSVFADVIPILGNFVGWTTGIIAFGFAFIVSMVVIAISWLTVRPTLAFLLIGTGIVVFMITWLQLKSK